MSAIRRSAPEDSPSFRSMISFAMMSARAISSPPSPTGQLAADGAGVASCVSPGPPSTATQPPATDGRTSRETQSRTSSLSSHFETATSLSNAEGDMTTISHLFRMVSTMQ